MSVNYFTFDGESSLDYGVYIGGQNTFNAPQRDVSKISIPGRNGDLIQDNGRFLNVQVPYNIVVMSDFRTKTDDIKAWLLSKVGYKRLEDTYHPNTYRMARVNGGIDFETSAFNLTGKTRVIFDCKPQRFLDSGDELSVFTSAGSLENPTNFDSEPVIRVSGTGSGTVTINNEIITITDMRGFVVIDSFIKNCYKNTENKNSDVSLPGHEFPVLKPGINNISFSGAVTSVSILGKWWTI